MIGSHRVLGLITARGGSKGVPRKNVRPLAGKPLIAWTVEAARASNYIDRLVISSDDDEIIGVAEAYGCEAPFKRPANLARDETPGVAPVLHALGNLPGYDAVVLLQPTSPLRSAADIDGALELWIRSSAPSCVSVTPVDKPPQWMYYLGDNMQLNPVLPPNRTAKRRQDVPPVYSLNGAVYVSTVETVEQTQELVGPDAVAYVMPPRRSVDIDTAEDFEWCEWLLRTR